MRVMQKLIRSAVVLAPLLLVACPKGSTTTSDAAKAACAKVGDSCEFAPGKLGLCIELEGDSGKTSLVCQSQH